MVHAPALEIRPLTTHEEFSDAVRLQREIWGFQEIELLPVRLFVVASKIGGQVMGAFDRGEMVAFCLCIPGLKRGAKPYLHSHMLGVMPAYRNTGLGPPDEMEAARVRAGAAFDLIEWTFDPLELKNAFFNIERLGAIVRRQVRNQYGSTSSHLHGGLPTDRLFAEWWLRSISASRMQAGISRTSRFCRSRLFRCRTISAICATLTGREHARSRRNVISAIRNALRHWARRDWIRAQRHARHILIRGMAIPAT